MKRILGFGMTLMLVFGLNALVFGQNPTPGSKEGMKGMPGGPEGPGMRGEHGMRGKRGEHGMRGKHGGPGMMGKRGMHGGPGMLLEMIEDLDLTDAQKIKLFDLKKKFRAEMKADHDAMKSKHEAMKSQMPGGDADRQKMHELMKAKQFGTITPEQQKQLDAMMQQHKAEMDKMMAERKTEMEASQKKAEAFHQELLGILTDTQKQQLQKMHDEKMKQMQERMKDHPRRGHGGPMGPPPPPKPGE